MRKAFRQFFSAFAMFFSATERAAKSLDNLAKITELSTETMVAEAQAEHEQRRLELEAQLAITN